MNTTLVQCGGCGGHIARLDRDNGECLGCGKQLSVSMDIGPYMGEGEVLVWSVSGDLLGFTTIEEG